MIIIDKNSLTVHGDTEELATELTLCIMTLLKEGIFDEDTVDHIAEVAKTVPDEMYVKEVEEKRITSDWGRRN